MAAERQFAIDRMDETYRAVADEGQGSGQPLAGERSAAEAAGHHQIEIAHRPVNELAGDRPVAGESRGTVTDEIDGAILLALEPHALAIEQHDMAIIARKCRERSV